MDRRNINWFQSINIAACVRIFGISQTGNAAISFWFDEARSPRPCATERTMDVVMTLIELSVIESSADWCLKAEFNRKNRWIGVLGGRLQLINNFNWRLVSLINTYAN